MNQPITAASQLAALILKDAGDAPSVQPDKTDNTAPFRAETLKRAEMYGVAHARGEASLTKLAYWFSEGVRSHGLTEGDAEAVYKAFVAGHNRHVATAGTGHELMATDEKSLKVPTSIFRTFGKCGPVSMGDGFYARVITVRHGIGPEDRAGSAYNAMVKCNREIVKLAEKSAQVVVSDDDIRGWITKPVVASKDELAKLEELVVKIAKLAIANPVSLAGLSEPTSGLEQFVARAKLLLNRAPTTLEVMSERETVAAEAKEEAELKAA